VTDKVCAAGVGGSREGWGVGGGGGMVGGVPGVGGGSNGMSVRSEKDVVLGRRGRSNPVGGG